MKEVLIQEDRAAFVSLPAVPLPIVNQAAGCGSQHRSLSDLQRLLRLGFRFAGPHFPCWGPVAGENDLFTVAGPVGIVVLVFIRLAGQ